MTKKPQPTKKSETPDDIKTVLEKVLKDCGDESVLVMNDDHNANVESIRTGSIALDHALGTDGFPSGRLIEIYGPEASGKTTLALHALANAQKQKRADGTPYICGFVDMEHALDSNYARQLGVDINALLFAQPSCGEEALSLTESMVKNGVKLVVVDSVAALVPRQELEGDIEDTQVALQARMMGKAMRRLTGPNSENKSIIIFINQIRYKIGGYGNPEDTTGGKALKFYSSVRIDIRRKQWIKRNDQIIGTHSRAKVVKNKMSPPMREAEFQIVFGRGINKYNEVVDMASKMGFLQKSGNWYSYNNNQIGNGVEKTEEFLHDNPEIFAELEQKVRNQLWNPAETAVA